MSQRMKGNTMERKLPPFFHMIYEKSPLQRKMIQTFINSRDEVYWQRVQHFSENLVPFLESRGVSLEYVVDAYLKMCHDMLKEQVAFKKTGQYTAKTAAEVNSRVYSSEIVMTSYMYGLALSQFLWPNHYAMFDYFIRKSAGLASVGSYLEIGPGHGLFLLESLRFFSQARFVAVDISSISIRISKSLVNHFMPQARCEFINQDVNGLVAQREFDYIVMCELLEHVDRPIDILRKTHSLLSDSGHCFITTCANAPAVDHVYLYDSVEHIQRELEQAGFQIIDELALPVGNIPRGRWIKDKVEVNYAALLSKKTNGAR